MWTIMVWLYDFQARYSAYPGMVMAALTLASVPTLLVFLFCQRIIDLPPQMYPHTVPQLNIPSRPETYPNLLSPCFLDIRDV